MKCQTLVKEKNSHNSNKYSNVALGGLCLSVFSGLQISVLWLGSGFFVIMLNQASMNLRSVGGSVPPQCMIPR